MKTIALLLLLIFVLGFIGCKGKMQTSLLVYAGAGIKEPLDEVVDIYMRDTGVNVSVIYAGSGELLAQIENTKIGDIFMPGGMVHFNKAINKGLIKKSAEFVYNEPVILVKKGNPKDIKGLLDLAKPGLKLALGDEKALAIGPITKQMLEKADIYSEVEKNVVVREATVSKLVLDVDDTDIDASIVWETAESQFGKNVEAIPIEKEYIEIEKVPIGILKFTTNMEEAEKFMNFVLSDESFKIFEKWGYKAIKR